MKRLNTIDSADLEWRDDGLPVSKRFGDVYFSADNGLAESRHVFLAGCGLPEAWAGHESFVIGETGFGTGLNFLAAWDLWRREGQGRLHFVSVEGYPLSRDELTRALSAWPELSELSQALLTVYPEPQPGFHRLLLDGGKVTLTLLMGEAQEMLSQLEARVDAWFLDGFAPSENPDMWRPEVLAELARLSGPGTRLSTFTVAGAVRRALKDVGFAVEKTPGFGRKREMLSARFEGEVASSSLEPWFQPPRPIHPKTVAVVGGGIAGCAIAEAFHRRGVKVTIHERRNELAAEASGNPMGLLMPRLTTKPTPEGAFFIAAFQYALHRLKTLGAAAGFSQCGVLELGRKEKAEIKHRKLDEAEVLPKSMMRRVDAAEASDLAGVLLEQGGMFHSFAGWLRPSAYCKALAEGVEVKLGTQPDCVDALDADVVVLANGLAAKEWEQAAWVPLSGMRGQISLPKATPDSERLKCVLTYKGYLTPAVDGRHCLGATYGEQGDVQTDIRDGDRDENFALLDGVLPGLFPETTSEGRASVRCVVSDWMPVVGGAPDYQAYLTGYDRLRHGDRRCAYPPPSYHQRLYLMTGLGSRGMVSAPLAAELLASQICGDPWPVAREVATILHPARFIVRDLKYQRV